MLLLSLSTIILSSLLRLYKIGLSPPIGLATFKSVDLLLSNELFSATSSQGEERLENITIPKSVWEDLNLSSNVICGGFKCFIRSASDDTIGYLISKHPSIFDDMMKATEVAKELAHKYGAKHLYIEPPYNASMPDEIMNQLNTVAKHPLTPNKKSGFFTKPSVVVQKMKTAKEPSLFFACLSPNKKVTRARLPTFASLVVGLGYKEEFQSNIAEEQKRLRLMLLDMPGLGADLQGLISPKGEFFYIDLDAHIYWSGKEIKTFENGIPSQKCVKLFNDIDSALENASKMI